MEIPTCVTIHKTPVTHRMGFLHLSTSAVYSMTSDPQLFWVVYNLAWHFSESNLHTGISQPLLIIHHNRKSHNGIYGRIGFPKWF